MSKLVNGKVGEFFFIKKSLGELGPGGSPRSGQASRINERLQITHQQGPHIGSRNRTHAFLQDMNPFLTIWTNF